MKRHYKQMEMKDIDEMEYDLVLNNETETDNTFYQWNSCINFFDFFGKYCCSEYGKSVHFTQTIHSLIQKNHSNVIFIDHLVHGNMNIEEIKDIIITNTKNKRDYFILCFRLEGKIVDHIVVITFDFNKNKITYFDSKGGNPFGDIRIIRGLTDNDKRQLRPINLCSTIREILTKQNHKIPEFVYNTEKMQSWWDFWSCGVHTLVYIEKNILYDCNPLFVIEQ